MTSPGTGKEPSLPDDWKGNREQLISQIPPRSAEGPTRRLGWGLHNELLTWPDAMIIWWAILGSNQ